MTPINVFCVASVSGYVTSRVLGILDFAFRGINTRVSTIADISLAEAGCDSCLACVAVCPVGSLVVKSGVSLDKHKALISVATGNIL